MKIDRLLDKSMFKLFSLVLGVILALGSSAAIAASAQTPEFNAKNNQLIFVKREGKVFYFKRSGDTSPNPSYQVLIAPHASFDSYPVAIYAKTIDQSQFDLQPVYVKSGYVASDMKIPETNPRSGPTAQGLVIYSPNPDANPVSFSVRKEDGSDAYFTEVIVPSAIEEQTGDPSKKMAVGFATSAAGFSWLGVQPDWSFAGAYEVQPPGGAAVIKTLDVAVNLTDTAAPFTTARIGSTYDTNPYSANGVVVLTGWAVFATDTEPTALQKELNRATVVHVIPKSK